MTTENLKEKFNELYEVFSKYDKLYLSKYQSGEMDFNTYQRYLFKRQLMCTHIASWNERDSHNLMDSAKTKIDFSRSNYFLVVLRNFIDYAYGHAKRNVDVQKHNNTTEGEKLEQRFLKQLNEDIEEVTLTLSEFVNSFLSIDQSFIRKFAAQLRYIIECDLAYISGGGDFNLQARLPLAIVVAEKLTRKFNKLIWEIEKELEKFSSGYQLETGKGAEYNLLESFREFPEKMLTMVNQFQERVEELFNECIDLKQRIVAENYINTSGKQLRELDDLKKELPNLNFSVVSSKFAVLVFLIDKNPNLKNTLKVIDDIPQLRILCKSLINPFADEEIFTNLIMSYKQFPEVFSNSFFEYFINQEDKNIFNFFKNNYEDKFKTLDLIKKSSFYPKIEECRKLDAEMEWREYNLDSSGSMTTIGQNISSLVANGVMHSGNYEKLLTLLLSPTNNHNQVTDMALSKIDEDIERVYGRKLFKLLQLNEPQKKEFVKLFFATPMGEFAIRNLSRIGLINNMGEIFNLILKSWGKQANFAPKIAEFFALNRYIFELRSNSYQDNNILLNLILNPEYNVVPTNFEQLSNIIRQFLFISRKVHNFYGNRYYSSGELLDVIATFIKNKYDVTNNALDKAIDIVFNDTILNTVDFNKKCYLLGFHPQDIIEPLVRMKNQFANHRLELNKAEIYDLDNKINLVEVYDSIKTYKEVKKDKVPELFKLNYIINDQLKFEVLHNNSFEYFTVGSATNCCQRVNREGAAACVDSYINPLAGVLVLRGTLNHQGKKREVVIAQSYFHYVPEDNGYILDNVETSENYVKYFKINLDSLYASLAKKVETDYQIYYFRCGKGYNKLNSQSFKDIKTIDDRRHFEIEELELSVPTGNGTATRRRYVDYHPDNALNLLSPSKDLKIVPLEKLEFNKLSRNFYFRCLTILKNI